MPYHCSWKAIILIATVLALFGIFTLTLCAQESGQTPPAGDQLSEGNQPGETDINQPGIDPAQEIEKMIETGEIVTPASPPTPVEFENPGSFEVADFPNDEGSAFLITWPFTEKEIQAGIERIKIEEKYVQEKKIARKKGGVDAESQIVRDEPTIKLDYRYRILHSESPDEFVNGNITPIESDEENGIEANYVNLDPVMVTLAPDRKYKLGDTLETLRVHFWPEKIDRKFHAYQFAVPWLPILDKKTKEPKFAPDGTDLTYVDVENEHYFQLAVIDQDGNMLSYVASPRSAKAISNGFHMLRLNNSIIAIVYCLVVLWFITNARKGKELFIRRIAGLDAVDEAIGRATEMGRPILYLTGLDSMSTIATIAAVNILGQVAKKVADYDSQLLVPSFDPIVMSVCQEVVKEAYMDAGRPDAYNPDSIYFLTNDQFSYVASIDGIMIREKPATNIFMGYYYAESLILAETGGATGAIQIAGTDALAQLPFFITTCDYTLIGEELYAASAYLAREPLLLGSLKGQDVGKMFLMVTLVVGVILMTITAKLDLISMIFQAE